MKNVGVASATEMVDYKSKGSSGKRLVFGLYGTLRKSLRSEKLLLVSKQKAKVNFRLWTLEKKHSHSKRKEQLSHAVEIKVTKGQATPSVRIETRDTPYTTMEDFAKSTASEVDTRETLNITSNNGISNVNYEHGDRSDYRSERANTEKTSLAEELVKLNEYGWYWGAISGDEADAKLISEPDGAFLVRDSSDDRYLLTLSFKSSGKPFHARMRQRDGLFSLFNNEESQGFTSVAALIGHSMNHSQSAVYGYSRPRYPGHPRFPVRLTKPISRFTQVPTLQYLCRSTIRQRVNFDDIRKLPLPNYMKHYLEEKHFSRPFSAQ